MELLFTGREWSELGSRDIDGKAGRPIERERTSQWIPELGIYDYRHRMYHPSLGRFLQTDPTGFDAGNMNLFRYCGDDPVDRSDPTGLLSGFREYQLVYDPNEKIDATHDGYHVAGVSGTENRAGDSVHLEVDRAVNTVPHLRDNQPGVTTHQTTATNDKGAPTIHEQINVKYAANAGPKTQTFTRNNEWTHSRDLITAANHYRSQAQGWATARGMSESSVMGMLQHGGFRGLAESVSQFNRASFKESFDRWDSLEHAWKAPNGLYVTPHNPIDPESGNPLQYNQ